MSALGPPIGCHTLAPVCDRISIVLAVQGGSKVQDAAYIYQELGDKFNWTVRVPRLL